MYERLKRIREEKLMTQQDFSALLGIGQSTLAMMEVGKRDILDRHIKTICSICHINEDWFRTGQGSMHVDSNIIHALINKYDLDSPDVKVLESYLALNKNQKNKIRPYLQAIIDIVSGET